MEPKRRLKKPNPSTTTNWFSRVFFCWCNRLMSLGKKGDIKESDLYDTPAEFSSVKLNSQLERQWEKELYKWNSGQDACLWRAQKTAFRFNYLAFGVINVLLECFRISLALLLGRFMMFFENETTQFPQYLPYVYAASVCVFFMLVTVLDHASSHLCMCTGLSLRTAMTSLIYKKILRMRHFPVPDPNTIGMLSLLTKDINSFDQSCVFAIYIWLAPIEVFVVTAILWVYVGIGASSLIVFVLAWLIVPIQYKIRTYTSKLRDKMAVFTERRVRQMGEILYGIETIKLFCWENAFSSLIQAVRRSELAYLTVLKRWSGLYFVLEFISRHILIFLTFAVFVLLGNNASPSILFSSMALFDVIYTRFVHTFAWTMHYRKESRKAVLNIQEFLLFDEKARLEAPNLLGLMKDSPMPANVSIRFEDYSSAWTKDQDTGPTLENINLNVRKGQLIVITGNGGSGKSSLLLSLLGELPRLGGFVRTNGKVGYLPQNNWIFDATFRENVTIGLEMDSHKYNKVLYACDLVKDLDALPNNDLTQVGQHGVSLTSGQKAKIGLARAVYHGADIFLVDDIFGAVDDREAVHIFTKCFCGLISACTIVIVTQKYKFIKAADFVLVLKEGKVEQSGSFKELSGKGFRFQDIAEDYETEQTTARIKDKTISTSLQKAEPSTDSHGITSDTTMRQQLWLDHFYSSQENLDKIWLQFEYASDCELLSRGEKNSDSEPFAIINYLRYLCIGGGCGTFMFLLLSVFSQGAYILADWCLYYWSHKQYSHLVDSMATDTDVHSNNITLTTTLSMPFRPSMFSFGFFRPIDEFYIYVGIFASFILLLAVASVVFNVLSSTTSRSLHDDAFFKILRASLLYIEQNYVSKVWNIFGQDVCSVDESLPFTFHVIVQSQLQVLSIFVLLIAANYWMALCLLLVLPPIWYLTNIRLKTIRQLRCLEMGDKKAVEQHMCNSVEGLWTVRAFGAEERFQKYFNIYQDRYSAVTYICLSINRWFAIRIDIFTVLLICALTFSSVAVKDFNNINPGLLGLSLVYALQRLCLVQSSARQLTTIDEQLTGVHRLEELRQLPVEGLVFSSTRPNSLWPQYGIITFEGVSLNYGDDGTCMLKSLWTCFRAEEKIGIIGKPKTCSRAILAALVHMSSPTSGIIRIDGVDISELGLQDIREKISVVTQDPALFGVSVRRNLDPYNRHTDSVLWKALETVRLREKVECLPGKLYAELADFVNYFSLGERQLLSVARCLLRPSKVLIFEETSSIIEKRCERLIHHILCTRFSSSTVVTIAQRLNSIIDCDRVMVLHDGKMKEFDQSHILLQNNKSFFYRMAHALPEQQIAVFKQVAKDKFENKPYRPPTQSLDGQTTTPFVSVQPGRMKAFLPSFQTSRIQGVLQNFTSN